MEPALVSQKQHVDGLLRAEVIIMGASGPKKAKTFANIFNTNILPDGKIFSAC